MIQFIIENREIELSEELLISFTYETVDPDKLSSIKNSFSKTINIPGTPNNNDAFGNIFRIDRYIPVRSIYQDGSVNDYNWNIGFQFDPHKKADFNILSNGSIITSGYATLTNIVIKNQIDVTYQLVLYGGIGNFFYSLTNKTVDNLENIDILDDSGQQMNLADLYWNWKPKTTFSGYGQPMTREDEGKTYDEYGFEIYKGSAAIITQAYHNLKPEEEIYYGTENDGPEYWNSKYQKPYPITEIDKDIVFIPCYTGTYDDFDSNKMLVGTFNQRYNTSDTYSTEKLQRLNNAFPDSEEFVDDEETKTYTTLNKQLNTDAINPYRYGIATFSRDLDPWEAGDIRVNEIPVAIRLSKLMRTLSMPWNNGGYEVDWDKDITESPYWNYTWVTLGKIKKEEEGFSPTEISLDNKTSLISYRYNVFYDYTPVTHLASRYDLINPSLNNYSVYSGQINKGNYNILLRYNPKYELQYTGRQSYLEEPNKYPIIGGYKSGGISYMQFDVIYTEINTNGPKDFYFDIFFYTERPNTYGFGFGGPKNDMLKQIRRELIYQISNLGSYEFPESDINKRIRIHNISGNRGGIGTIDFQGTTLPGISIECPQQTIQMYLNLSETQNVDINSIHFNMFLAYSSSNIYDHPISVGLIKTTGDVSTVSPNYWENDNTRVNNNLPYIPSGNFVIIETKSNGSEKIRPLMSTDIGAISQNRYFNLNGNTSSIFMINTDIGTTIIHLDKRTLFAQSKTPAKYLIDFCKIMNYRFICDESHKKIYIKTLKNYYNSFNIESLDDLIDYSRDINIKNITTNNRLIEFGLSNLETYPIEISERVSKEKFSCEKYNTNVEWNQQITKLLNDSIYKNTIEWQQSSLFYNLNPQMPKAYNTPTISWTLFNLDNGDLDKKEFFEPGVSSSGTGLIKSTDQIPKIGYFNKENKYVETDTTLLFLNGFVKNYDYSKTRNIPSTIESLEPTSVTNDAIITITGNSSPSNSFNIWSFTGIDSNANYYFSGRSTSYSPENNYYFVFYYDSNDILLGYEIPMTSGTLITDYQLTIPDYTVKININVSKDYISSYDLKKETLAPQYVISPRNQFSEDTIEQYILNGNRCYIWDFKYNDVFDSWGAFQYSVNEKERGHSCPWVLPFFARELFNEYEIDTNTPIEKTINPVEIYTDQVVLSTGLLASNSNYDVYEFLVDESLVNYKFSANYPSTSESICLAEYDEDNNFIRSEGIVSSTQYEFDHSSINLSGNVKILRLNVYKGYVGYITANEYGKHWINAGRKFASWNLVKQDIITKYDLSVMTFISNPDYAYGKFIDDTELSNIESKEYKINEWPDFSNYIFETNWRDYMNDLYNRNTRNVTLYINLTSLGTPNDILRKIYAWRGFLWIITKIENKQIEQRGKDIFTKCTIHKIDKIDTWTNNY